MCVRCNVRCVSVVGGGQKRLEKVSLADSLSLSRALSGAAGMLHPRARLLLSLTDWLSPLKTTLSAHQGAARARATWSSVARRRRSGGAPALARAQKKKNK